ncbi:Peptidase M56 BlaR1 [[Clostridium] ultunense Esp]|nr:Peptidase M56 BlaR1 [[Clostridium] ultunense Esp]
MKPALKLNLSFGFVILFSLLVLFQMGLFAAHQVWGVPIKWDLFQYCLTIIQEASLGYNFIQVLLNLLIAYTSIRIFWRLIKQWYLTRKWTHWFREKTDPRLTKRLNDRYRNWRIRFVVVEDDGFIALTMGLFKPRIIVSTGLFRLFSKREAEAILLHEMYHCRHYDPLKAFLFAVISDGFGYIPIIKAAALHYKTWKELLADRYAMRQMGTEYYLGQVLLRMANWGNRHKVIVGVSFADAAMNFRILQVLEPNKPISISFLRWNTVILSMWILLAMLSMGMGGCSS